MRIFCKFVEAWSHWSIQKRNAEAQKAKQLFIPLNIILPEAELEEKKKSSFLRLSTSAFRFLDDSYAEHKTPKTREPNETNTS